MKRKDTEEKTGPLRSFLQLFTRNWALKLVSLALAVLIYYTLKPSGDGRRREPSTVAEVINQVTTPAPAPAETPPADKKNAP